MSYENFIVNGGFNIDKYTASTEGDMVEEHFAVFWFDKFD